MGVIPFTRTIDFSKRPPMEAPEIGDESFCFSPESSEYLTKLSGFRYLLQAYFDLVYCLILWMDEILHLRNPIIQRKTITWR